jgi:hypothetical protein
MAKQAKTLAVPSSRDLENFLVELVNLQDDPSDIRRFVKRFADYGVSDERIAQAIFHIPDNAPFPFERMAALPPEVFLDEYRTTQQQGMVPYLRSIFRATWVEPDAKVRRWAWAILRTDLARVAFPGPYLEMISESGQVRLPKPPPYLPLETAFEFLLDHHNRARHCPYAECPAPYFFAKKHTQRYCSEKCAQSGEKETKRRWWSEYGIAWRKGRKLAATTASKKQRKTTTKRRKGKSHGSKTN